MSLMASEPIQGFNSRLERIKELLSNFNQVWAIELCGQIINDIGKKDLPASQRLSLFNRIIKVWRSHLSILVRDFVQNWPFIYNAYHHLFNLLLKIKDHNRITDNGIRLVKNLIKIQFATKEQIANLLDDLAIMIFKTNNYRKAIQIIFIAIFFRKTYKKNKYFDKCFNQLDVILKRLSPNEKSIVLDYLLMNTYNEFFTSKSEKGDKQAIEIYGDKVEYSDFLDDIYRSIVNSVGTALRESIQNVKKINRQIRDKQKNLDDVKSTIFHLQIIEKHDWAFLVMKTYSDLLLNKEKYKDAYNFAEEFKELSFQKGAFQTTFDAYKLMTKILEIHTQTQTEDNERKKFPTEIAKVWARASEGFKNLKNKSFFVQSVNQFQKIIGLPEQYNDYQEFQNYLFAADEYYRIIRGYIQPSERLFWIVVLHRCIFEEGFRDVADYALQRVSLQDLSFKDKMLEDDISSTLHWKKEKSDSGISLTSDGKEPQKITIKLRIPEKEAIKFFIKIYYNNKNNSSDIYKYEELWHEPYLVELYKKNPHFGKIGYLLLPKELRETISRLKIGSNHVPEVFVIQDKPTYPLEMLDDGKKTLGTQFAFGYRFKEPKLSPDFDGFSLEDRDFTAKNKFNVLSIGDLNKHSPKIWVEKEHQSKPIFPFPQGVEQSRFVSMKMRELEHLINNFRSINPQSSDFNTIQDELLSGRYHIIHFAANLFYIEENPSESYFLTSDNKALSFSTIIEMLSYAKKHNEVQKKPFRPPLFIFDGVLIHNGKVKTKPFELISKIFSKTTSALTRGIFARISTEFNDYLQQYLYNFLERILIGESIGSGLLTANRHLYLMARRLLRKDQSKSNLFSLLTETHYVFYGDPFLRLSKT